MAKQDFYSTSSLFLFLLDFKRCKDKDSESMIHQLLLSVCSTFKILYIYILYIAKTLDCIHDKHLFIFKSSILKNLEVEIAQSGA